MALGLIQGNLLMDIDNKDDLTIWQGFFFAFLQFFTMGNLFGNLFYAFKLKYCYWHCSLGPSYGTTPDWATPEQLSIPLNKLPWSEHTFLNCGLTLSKFHPASISDLDERLTSLSSSFCYNNKKPTDQRDLEQKQMIPTFHLPFLLSRPLACTFSF